MNSIKHLAIHFLVQTRKSSSVLQCFSLYMILWHCYIMFKTDGFCHMDFHPSRKVGHFQVMWRCSLKELKEHTSAVGGAFGDDTWATLVRDSALDVTEVEGEDSLDDTQAKRALL